MEIYKDIKDYEGYYQVSNLGNVKALKREIYHERLGTVIRKERMLKQQNYNGYKTVGLHKDGIQKLARVHMLVAIAFLNHTPNGRKININHINHNSLDNRLENLEVITQRENTNKKHLQSTSKYVGVSLSKHIKKWMARINIKGQQKYLGVFKTEIEASNAYQNELKNIINGS